MPYAVRCLSMCVSFPVHVYLRAPGGELSFVYKTSESTNIPKWASTTCARARACTSTPVYTRMRMLARSHTHVHIRMHPGMLPGQERDKGMAETHAQWRTSSCLVGSLVGMVMA